MRRIALVVVYASIAASVTSVFAQTNYPERNIRLLYGFPPGNDLVARIYADKLAEALGKPVIVENLTGGGGNIAADRTAKARPDGYTIGFLPQANIIINTMLYRKLSFDPLNDLIPVTQIFGYPNLLLVNNEVPAKTVQELVALARANPDKLTYGHNGVGTTTHLAPELFKLMARIKVQDVPYRGPSPVVADMMSGRITMTFNAPGPLLPLIREQKIRALAVTSLSRAPFAPNVPTMEESGFAGFDFTVWFGIFLPAGTPPFIVEKLNRESIKIMSSPEIGKRLIDLGNIPLWNSPVEFSKQIEAERPFWARIIKDAGVQPIE